MIYDMNKRRKRPKKCPSMLDRDIKCAVISTYLPIVNTLFPLTVCVCVCVCFDQLGQ